MTAYDRLTARFARIATIGEASSVLGWDAATMMPPGGGSARGDQLAVLAGMSHSLLVAPVVGDDLAEAEATEETDPWRAANLPESFATFRTAPSRRVPANEGRSQRCLSCRDSATRAS